MNQTGIEYGPRPVTWAVARENPLIASFTKLDPNAPHPISGRIYRDRDGNERHEFVLHDPSQGEAQLAFIRRVDPPELLILEDSRRVILARDKLTGWAPETVGFGARFLRDHTRIIEGYECCLVKFTTPGDLDGVTDSGELWWCEELQLTLLENPAGNQIVYRVFNIERGDVPPDLFAGRGYKMPGGALIFDTTGC